MESFSGTFAFFKNNVWFKTSQSATFKGTIAEHKESLALGRGGVAADYAVVEITDATTLARMKARHPHTIAVDGTVDFSADNNKLFIVATTDQTEVDGDGVDEATITLQVYNTNPADGTRGTVNTSTNATFLVPVMSPNGPRLVSVTASSGVATKKLKKRSDNDIGQWIIPAPFRRGGAKAIGADSVTVDILADLS